MSPSKKSNLLEDHVAHHLDNNTEDCTMVRSSTCAAYAAVLALLTVTSSWNGVSGQDVGCLGSPSPSDGQSAVISQSRYAKGFCPNGTKGTLRVSGQGIKEAKSDQAKARAPARRSCFQHQSFESFFYRSSLSWTVLAPRAYAKSHLACLCSCSHV